MTLGGGHFLSYMGGGADPGGVRNIFEGNGGAYETFGKNMVGVWNISWISLGASETFLNFWSVLVWGVWNIFSKKFWGAWNKLKNFISQNHIKNSKKYHQFLIKWINFRISRTLYSLVPNTTTYLQLQIVYFNFNIKLQRKF